MPILDDLADGVTRRAERLGDGLSGLFEPVIRLGVTGLSRAGKTVFITSLVANLLDRGRMGGLEPVDRIAAAFLQPQPDDTVPRFDHETHLAALAGRVPHWPESTRALSQLRLSLRIRPAGLLSGVTGLRTVHLDIVDYPGEWLLDLGLMGQSYTEWSGEVLRRIEPRPAARAFLDRAHALHGAERFDEPLAQKLARLYTGYLQAARAQGLAACTPGRFLLPGDLDGAPVLTFAPLPAPRKTGRRSLWREMERRFDAYKAQVVRPFFRNHFARIDRQVVLVDVLGAIHDGPEAVEELRRSMADILRVFRPGGNDWLSRRLRGRRVDRILFAATKVDHLHHGQHPCLTRILDALLREARDRAGFSGAQTASLAIASLRATVEEERKHEGRILGCVRGERPDGGGQAAFHPGELPENPRDILEPARTGARKWLDAEYGIMRFAPAPSSRRQDEGLPHIRLDRAAQFLLSDRL